ncbi:hypothetical protein Tcan_17799 [Toxocara canis]|uniref:Uncharacterized protein n=1 Tax=Toxocara canis TaxID=6265 RepID=A0A0B2VVL2_TOXCA|nr:hypothetical protein Tcan_17799 [Toxocara canis]
MMPFVVDLFSEYHTHQHHQAKAYDIQPLEDFPETILDFEGEDAEDYLENGEPHAYDIQPLEDFPETILDFEGEDAEDYLENGEPHVNGIMTETPEPESTCRIKLLRPELPPDMQPESTADLKCAVNVKERIEINVFMHNYHFGVTRVELHPQKRATL